MTRATRASWGSCASDADSFSVSAVRRISIVNPHQLPLRKDEQIHTQDGWGTQWHWLWHPYIAAHERYSIPQAPHFRATPLVLHSFALSQSTTQTGDDTERAAQTGEDGMPKI